MKKITKILLVTVLALSLVACGKTEPQIETEPAVTTTPTAEPTKAPELDDINVVVETQVTLIEGADKYVSDIIRNVTIGDVLPIETLNTEVTATPTDEIVEVADVTPTDDIVEVTATPTVEVEAVPINEPVEPTEQEKSIKIELKVGEFEDTITLEQLPTYTLNLVEVGEHELNIKITADDANDFETTVKLIVVPKVIEEVQNITDNIKLATEVEDYNFDRRLQPSDKIETVSTDTSQVEYGTPGVYEVIYTVKPAPVEETVTPEGETPTKETATVEQPEIKVPVEVEVVDDTKKDELIDSGVPVIDNEAIAKEDELEEIGEPVVEVTPAPEGEATEKKKVQKQRLVSEAVYETVLVSPAVPAQAAKYETKQVETSPAKPAVPGKEAVYKTERVKVAEAVPGKDAVYQNQIINVCRTCGSDISYIERQHLDETLHAGYFNKSESVLVSPAVPAKPAVYEERQVLVSAAVPAQPAQAAQYKTEKVEVSPAVPAKEAVYKKVLKTPAVYEYYWE